MTASQAQIDKEEQADAIRIADQYLTFLLDGEEYGLEILRVQEIKGWEAVTPMPNTPVYVLGVINLRGAVVPVIDLRKRFNLEGTTFGPSTVIIVLKISNSDLERVVGFVVDAVSEVYRFDRDDVQPPPDLGNSISTEYLRGLVMVEEKMVILLEVNRLIGSGVLEITDESAGDAVEVV